jgi:hypothetical protein
MVFNPYLTQWLREERVKDALRNAEQARLIRAAKGAGTAQKPAFHRLLLKIRNLGLPLISAHRIEPDLPALQQR